MRKYLYWTFKILWLFLSIFITRGIKTDSNLGMVVFILILLPLLYFYKLIADKFIKIKKIISSKNKRRFIKNTTLLIYNPVEDMFSVTIITSVSLYVKEPSVITRLLYFFL
jgi:hypothetical protein